VRRSSTGAVANLSLGGHDVLVQQNWLASTPQRCGLTA
jgi:hypothetical protein